MNTQAQLSASQQLQSSGPGVTPTLEDSGAGADDDDDDIPDLEAAEEDGPLDETGVDPKDIDLVMQQVNCSRTKAVRVLKESGGDLINASELISECLFQLLSLMPPFSSHGRERVDFQSPSSPCSFSYPIVLLCGISELHSYIHSV